MRLDPLDVLAARQFLPRLKPAAFIEAYAACAGYPLHLREWDQQESTDANLLRLAGTAGGILLDDAQTILREELPETGGYARVLAAIGRGRTRYSEIQNEADQRVEHPLEVLVHADFVRRSLPVGAPKRARPLYEIADPYISFWFSVLYSDLPLIEGGQGRAALHRLKPRWQKHLGHVFEEAARNHARRLITAGELPADLVVGRWWATSGQPCEVDVLGLTGNKTYLVGEARWQDRPLGARALNELRRKVARVPKPVDEPILALWGRSGVDREVTRQGARGFDVRALLRQLQ
jgi:AAA+ ATPase superfamily predicted ATPase